MAKVLVEVVAGRDRKWVGKVVIGARGATMTPATPAGMPGKIENHLVEQYSTLSQVLCYHLRLDASH